ncbi:hypothetical protein DACRYDRAFT_111320 [Dacryopinax primogenitus]|uniref:Uncharacterized protein n=1 Tax=Dacryopinax primogenitus (strain DJM 731) TaxID=1858805 RepID=M5FQK8_DACPD|nr:uncharacterized protein DACRYDRAFT_111320 [Dacryopinax primogenitus]EJT97803.1 hypothetical protein DACRYDRAFT_111320 [Dacryopinax primogenitus]
MARTRDSTDSLASLDSHVSSLPSVLSLSSSEEELQRLQKEWDEQMEQFRIIIEVVALPFFGKWLGRKSAHWVYRRWLTMGWTARFFVGETIAREFASIEAFFTL